MESKTLGHLQVIISSAIAQNGGSAPFDYICSYAKKVFLLFYFLFFLPPPPFFLRLFSPYSSLLNSCKFASAFKWSVDRKRGFTKYLATPGSLSINPEVLADAVKVSLDEKSSVKFKKDPHRAGNWMLAEQPPTPTSSKKDANKAPPQTKVLSSTRTVVVQPPTPARKGRPKKVFERMYSTDSSEGSSGSDSSGSSSSSNEWEDDGDDEGGAGGTGGATERGSERGGESGGESEEKGGVVVATEGGRGRGGWRGGKRGRGRGRGRGSSNVDVGKS